MKTFDNAATRLLKRAIKYNIKTNDRFLAMKFSNDDYEFEQIEKKFKSIKRNN